MSKITVVKIFLLLLIVAVANPAGAAIGGPNAVAKPSKELTAREQEKLDKKKARLEKKLDKLETRLEKKAGKTPFGLWDDDKFRLGVLLLIAALLLAIIGSLISLAGIIPFIAGLLGLGGVILIIWSLVEQYG